MLTPADPGRGAACCAPTTMSGSSAGMTRRSRRLVVRRSFRTTLTARRCSQQLYAAEQLAEPLFEVLLELVDPRALLGDLGLRLSLHLGHARSHRPDLVVHQRVDASAHVFLGGVDLRAELCTQPGRHRLIEVR